MHYIVFCQSLGFIHYKRYLFVLGTLNLKYSQTNQNIFELVYREFVES